MTRGKLIVFTEPASPEVEGEFNAWYDDVHLPEVVALVPGIRAGERYKAVPGQPNNFPGEPSYVAIFDIETDNMATTMAGLGAAIGKFTMTATPTMKMDRPSLSMFVEEIGS